MSDKVIIFDTTLRDGEQSPGASMTRSEEHTSALHDALPIFFDLNPSQKGTDHGDHHGRQADHF